MELLKRDLHSSHSGHSSIGTPKGSNIKQSSDGGTDLVLEDWEDSECPEDFGLGDNYKIRKKKKKSNARGPLVLGDSLFEKCPASKEEENQSQDDQYRKRVEEEILKSEQVFF